MQRVNFYHFTGDTFIQKLPLTPVLPLANDGQIKHLSGHMPLPIQRLWVYGLLYCF